MAQVEITRDRRDRVAVERALGKLHHLTKGVIREVKHRQHHETKRQKSKRKDRERHRDEKERREYSRRQYSNQL